MSREDLKNFSAMSRAVRLSARQEALYKDFIARSADLQAGYKQGMEAAQKLFLQYLITYIPPEEPNGDNADASSLS
jgi:hypothetical protein